MAVRETRPLIQLVARRRVDGFMRSMAFLLTDEGNGRIKPWTKR
jgi:hypothetical protein